MYIVQAKSGAGVWQPCVYNASYHPSSFLPALAACLTFANCCLPIMYLLTCTPLPSLPTTPAQASVDEKSEEVRQLQAISSDPVAEADHQGPQEENDRDERGQPAQRIVGCGE